MTTTLSTLIDSYKATRDALPEGHPDRGHYDALIREASSMLAEFWRAQDRFQVPADQRGNHHD